MKFQSDRRRGQGVTFGPTLVNISVGNFYFKTVEDFLSQVFYIKYVDDCFVIPKT